MELSCDVCGKAFTAARSDAKYCSGRCRTQGYRQRHELAAPPQRRRPLGDDVFRAVMDLDRLAGRWERLVGDDRFRRNRSKLAKYRRDLVRARDVFDRILAEWPDPSQPTDL